MKQGLTIQEMATEILRQSEAKSDYHVNTQNLHMETCDGTPVLRLIEGGVDQVEPLDILPTAHHQLGDYLGIPRKYYDRMLQENIGGLYTRGMADGLFSCISTKYRWYIGYLYFLKRGQMFGI